MLFTCVPCPFIAEGTLSALRGYNEHLLRIRQKSTVFNKILEQVSVSYFLV